MRKEDVPLQQDMFTQTWVDNRSRSQKHTAGLQQMPMFSIHQTFTFGARVRPYLANTPRPPLELISEDTRTPEEIEQDLMREAQQYTALMPGLSPLDSPPSNEEKPDPAPMTLPVERSPAPIQSISVDTTLETAFGSPTVIPLEEPADEDTEDEADEEMLPPTAPPLSKYVAFRELVHVAEEQAAILSQSPAAALSETISTSLAQFEAKRAGLTESEIQMAVAIGTFRGKPQTEQQPAVPKPEPEPTDEDIPILWLNRSDLLKRRPDLASVIQTLGEHEVDFIASKVGEALEEFLWIQLNVVLSLYLDHELRLTRTVKKE
ncbi:MAG: hypothetical protein K8L97_20590 [Anaerolineae bacterium]|nr:hypothetical protein [Anaerolineae bacterium]